MRTFRKTLAVAAGAAALAASAAHAQDVDATSPTDGAPMTAVLSFVAADGQAVGGGMITDSGQSVSVSAQFSNLPAGSVGLRLHETGRCGPPDFESAGELIGSGRDRDDAETRLEVSETGVAIVQLDFPDVTLIGDGSDVLIDGDGAAVIVHAMAEDIREAAGERIACAVVQPD